MKPPLGVLKNPSQLLANHSLHGCFTMILRVSEAPLVYVGKKTEMCICALQSPLSKFTPFYYWHLVALEISRAAERIENFNNEGIRENPKIITTCLRSTSSKQGSPLSRPVMKQHWAPFQDKIWHLNLTAENSIPHSTTPSATPPGLHCAHAFPAWTPTWSLCRTMAYGVTTSCST